MSKSLFVFVLFFLSSHLIFAFQNTGQAVDDKKLTQTEFEITFTTPRADSEFKISPSKTLPEMKSSPFLMLSAYLEKENFNGNVFYKIETETGWSNWIPFPKNNHGKTPGKTIFLAGEIDPETKNIKLQTDLNISEKFVVRLFAPGHSEEIKINQTSKRSPENCICDQPTFCGRACWCPNGDCPIDTTPFSTTSTHVIVHHSAGNTTSSDFAAVVRSYWDLHVNTNGWDDIGYNWLVDGNGVIYEGRGSGLQGAHFSCMNENTTGICVIGNFENATPSSEAVQALQDFIAWEACDKNIEVLDADLHVSSGLNLDNISGHRDGNNSPNACSSTVCPGENLYDLLPTIRDEISSYSCLNDAVAVNTFLNTKTIEISPNPTREYFNVKWENLEVENIQIFDVTGKEIKYVNELLSQQNQQFSLNSDGFYFIKIGLIDDRTLTKKIIVKK